MNLRYVFLLSFLFSLITGCGVNVHVSGKVSFSDDQTPLSAGVVFFENNSFIARGVLQEDGTYRLGSEKTGNGLPPGHYRVYVSGATREIGIGKDGMPISEPLIAEKYASGSTSGLTATVDASNGKHDFQVDRFSP